MLQCRGGGGGVSMSADQKSTEAEDWSVGGVVRSLYASEIPLIVGAGVL